MNIIFFQYNPNNNFIIININAITINTNAINNNLLNINYHWFYQIYSTIYDGNKIFSKIIFPSVIYLLQYIGIYN